MRLYHFAYRLYDILLSVASVVALFTLTVVRTCYATTWHSLKTVKIAAYKVVGQLKREYAESYDTHGLSFSGGRIGT